MINFEIKSDSPIVDYFNSYKNRVLDKEELKTKITSGGQSLINKQNQNKIDLINEFNKLVFYPAVPIKVKDNLIGIYLLGQKKSEDPFTEEDIRLLRHGTGEIGFTIDNARMFEELKILDQIKSEFIAVVSHQLRTSVAIIKWNLELISDKNTSLKE